MSFLIIIVFVFLFVFSTTFNVIVSHPISSVKNAIIDFFSWLKYRKFNMMPSGQLIAYCGLFGKGKTLSAVHYVRKMYNRYNGKKVYDFEKKKWLKQCVLVLSNVELTDIPYLPFRSLSQIVSIAEENRKFDDLHDTLTVTLVPAIHLN